MKVNSETVGLAFRGFQTVFNEARDEAVSFKDKLAMVVNSQTSEETYGWLGQFPGLREWLGERVVKNLLDHGFVIKNRLYESTVKVPRTDIEDDRLGIYRPMFKEMGRTAKQHSDKMLFRLLAEGMLTLCYDGQPFFSTAHPVSEGVLGNDAVASNLMTGPTVTEGPMWYLLDLSRAIKPLIWQERIPYDLQAITDPNDARVFMTDEFMFGIRARMNCGFGLWQLAFACNQPLDAYNYGGARAQMMRLTGDQGDILGITPTHLLVPPSLEAAGRRLLNADINATGGGTMAESNVWKSSAELIVTPYLI